MRHFPGMTAFYWAGLLAGGGAGRRPGGRPRDRQRDHLPERPQQRAAAFTRDAQPGVDLDRLVSFIALRQGRPVHLRGAS